MKKHTHLIPGFPKMLHGGDYNPDQWVNYPGTVDRYLFIHNFGKTENAAETEFTGVSLIDGSRLDKTVKLASLASQVYKLDPQL